MNSEKAEDAIYINIKEYFRISILTRDKERHFHNSFEPVHQEAITVLNSSVSKLEAKEK